VPRAKLRRVRALLRVATAATPACAAGSACRVRITSAPACLVEQPLTCCAVARPAGAWQRGVQRWTLPGRRGPLHGRDCARREQPRAVQQPQRFTGRRVRVFPEDSPQPARLERGPAAVRCARSADAASSRQAALSKFTEALADAQKARRAGRRRSRRACAARLLTRAPFAAQTVELKPDWAKGYSRLGAALHGLRDYDEASATARPSLARRAHACARRRLSPPTTKAWRSIPPTSSSSQAWPTPRRRRHVRSLVARRARAVADRLGWRRLARRAAPTASATCSRRPTPWPRSWATRRRAPS
jgi:hypothetical protein